MLYFGLGSIMLVSSGGSPVKESSLLFVAYYGLMLNEKVEARAGLR